MLESASEVIGKIDPSSLSPSIPTFDLNEGEIFLGYYGGPDGRCVRVVLLPGDADPASWKKQMAWAQSIGGDLPNRIEQAMLFAYLRDEFRREWYWSNQLADFDNAYAWFQSFSYGGQYYYGVTSTLRARAVRREVI